MDIKHFNRIHAIDPVTFQEVQMTIANQDPLLARSSLTQQNVKQLLPQLIYLWLQIEHALGYQWKCTSYIRQSPSHQHGIALDIAPDINPGCFKNYAVYKHSDPVLYKRTRLMRVLQRVATDTNWPYPTQAIIAVEPDHLHLHILTEIDSSLNTAIRLVKWKVPKPVYSDTNERMKLGML